MEFFFFLNSSWRLVGLHPAKGHALNKVKYTGMDVPRTKVIKWKTDYCLKFRLKLTIDMAQDETFTYKIALASIFLFARKT